MEGEENFALVGVLQPANMVVEAPAEAECK